MHVGGDEVEPALIEWRPGGGLAFMHCSLAILPGSWQGRHDSCHLSHPLCKEHVVAADSPQGVVPLVWFSRSRPAVSSDLDGDALDCGEV